MSNEASDGLNYNDTLYDSSLAGTTEAFSLGLFDKKVLIPYDSFLERLVLEYPDLRISEDDVNLYVKDGYIPECFFDNEESYKCFHDAPLFISINISFFIRI